MTLEIQIFHKLKIIKILGFLSIKLNNKLILNNKKINQIILILKKLKIFLKNY